MSILRRILSGVRVLLRRDQDDRAVSDELRHFMDEAVAEHMAKGMSQREARRAVRMQFGDSTATREQIRASGWEHGIEVLMADLRLSVRRLRRSPGFAVVAVATLGLGIGSATAVFSAVGPILFGDLPYPDSDRLISIADRSEAGEPVAVTFGTFLEISARESSLASLAAIKTWQPTLTGGTEPERLDGMSVSAAYFDVLGVAPVLGAGFDRAEDVPGGARQVIVSDGFWRSRLNGDAAVIGSVLRLDEVGYTVVGVMPVGFTAPGVGTPQLWTLLQYNPGVADFDTREWGHHLEMIGRLEPGISLNRAAESLQATAASPMPEFARPTWANLGNGFLVRGLKQAQTAQLRPVTLVLLGAVALLLTVTCANLSLILLARAFRRRGEFAMRRALGAGKGRLVRFLATESVLLAGLGGLAGVFVARVGLSGLTALAPATLLARSTGALDGRALLFALALTLLVSLIFGLVPAGLGRSEALLGALRESDRSGVGGSWKARRALVVLEVAMAVTLLVGAGLLLRTTQQLFSSSAGFETSGSMVMQVHGAGLPSGDAATHGFFDQALEAVRSVPGVDAAAMTSQLPLTGEGDAYGVGLEGRPADAEEAGAAFRYAVSPSLLTTMGIQITRGRALSPADAVTRSAVVSESLARQLFADANPIGRRFHFGPTDGELYTIVGVAADVKQVSLDSSETNGIYVLSHSWHWADRVRWMVINTDRRIDEIAPDLRAAVWSVNGSQPILGMQTLDRLAAQSEGQRRFVQGVLIAFALSTLLLAGVGLYGVLAGAVAARTREVGIRMALGASRESILTMIMREGFALAAIGTLIGAGGAFAGTRLLESLIYGVSRVDPFTYLGVIVAMGIVAAVACWIPAARAGRADALDALRSE